MERTERTFKEPYNCPRSGKQETATIKATTFIRRSSRISGETTSVTRHNVTDCTGIDTCGVKSRYSSGLVVGATFNWEICPLLSTLNTR